MKKIFYILFISLSTSLCAQEAADLLKQAKQLVSDGAPAKSLAIIQQGLQSFPGDHDLLAYQARILLWEKEYAKADLVLNELQANYPNDYEVFELTITRNYWSERWAQLETATTHALSSFPKDLNFQEKKLLALIKQKKYNEANAYYQALGVTNVEIEALGRQVKLYYHDQVGVSTRYSYFDRVLSPWVEGQLAYRHTAKNSWNASATYADMFDEDGVRFNGEYYPTLTKNLYGFLSAGVSNAAIFPQYQYGAELTYRLKSLELAGGARRLKFKGQDDLINMVTLAAGYYLGQYYANYKAYFTTLEATGELTHSLLLRRFLKNRFHYLQLNVTNGGTPLQVTNFSEVSRLDATSVLLTYSHLLADRFIFYVAAGGQTEEYRNGAIRNRMTGSLGLSRIF